MSNLFNKEIEAPERIHGVNIDSQGAGPETSPFRPMVKSIQEREEHRALRRTRKSQEVINHG